MDNEDEMDPFFAGILEDSDDEDERRGSNGGEFKGLQDRGFGIQYGDLTHHSINSPILEIGTHGAASGSQNFSQTLSTELDGTTNRSDSAESNRSRQGLELDQKPSISSQYNSSEHGDPRDPHYTNHSLAYELASASNSRHGSERNLMRELGLSEDDEVEEVEQLTDSDEEMIGNTREHLVPGLNLQESYHLPDLSNPSNEGSPTLRNIREPASSNLLNGEKTEYGSQGSTSHEASNQSDALFETSITALEKTSTSTLNFLQQLRHHTMTSDVNWSKSSPDPNHTSPGPAASVNRRSSTDRQVIVEGLASSLVKSMYDFAQQREAQNLELAEMDRIFARSEKSWQATLAELDPLPEEQYSAHSLTEEEPPCLNETELGTGLDGRSSSLTIKSNGGPAVGLEDSITNKTTPIRSNSEPFVSLTPVLLAFSDLRAITTSLISALSTINESTQVNHSSAKDVGRRTRALRINHGALAEDIESVGQSERHIRAYEINQSHSGQAYFKDHYSKQAKKTMREAELLLEKGWNRAMQTLLTVS